MRITELLLYSTVPPMINAFSDRFFKITIATGLFFGTLGAYSSLQRHSTSTQHSLAGSASVMQPIVGSALRSALSWTAAAASVKFSPVPNPEPSGTGGTGTR
ncbi:MAG: hypothetical protein LH702_29335 [Phormidesmis sp. CAN_BIN44]|nr:hypothetical protein [Phormidesmis sp. CAN_BIN44]